ncbi:MAG TPA: HDIG domain-containing protein [Candidatus Nealsonbacteria bacterium]|uniref:HD domain-containing protein n=1 Tax=marine sediment metagenome TaxID=412755 RepID=A0A0F9XTA0_9ZZZZ|nr:HDIG domain-containing protein [Candidatus Nealsonbacteria bacterium]HEB46788.1 HDIG domain-containing protein [Candidatus Nealsonbacteria bacterium]
MNRDQALELLKQNLDNQNLIKHCLAVEAVMRALARQLGENEDQWGIAGLLHDIDYEKTKDDPNKHSLVGAQMLEEAGLSKEICQAVKVHNEIHGIQPEAPMDKALFTIDPLTGLIVAATLVLPSKKITDLTVENVLNRFKEKAFARGINREIIKQSEGLLDIKLEEFVKTGLQAMQKINKDLGL